MLTLDDEWYGDASTTGRMHRTPAAEMSANRSEGAGRRIRGRMSDLGWARWKLWDNQGSNGGRAGSIMWYVGIVIR